MSHLNLSLFSNQMADLKKADPKVYKIAEAEKTRQATHLNMIPSENFFSKAVREAVGSVFMHKYAEGNIGKRYYEGNWNVDELESLAIKRAKKLFNLPKDWSANVQALSGSSANLAVYLAALKAGDVMMGMYLPDGGHLSHGWSYQKATKAQAKTLVYEGGEKKVHISSRLYNPVQYKTDPSTRLFDYKQVEKIATEYKPKLIITGGTAYPRDIDYKKMKAIADKVGALYMADIAHEAGLIAAGSMSSPVGIADIVTMTTHKTLRAGRGSIILAHQDFIKKVNRAVLPGLQGGPFNNNIAGICVGLGEALKPEFKDYTDQIIKNAQKLAEALMEHGFDVITGGTDKHLVLVDLTNKGIFGKYTARALAIAGIIMNMNTMPQETRSPADPSAIRMGTPWLTTQGMKEKEMDQVASFINEVVEEATKFKNLEFDEFQKKLDKSTQIKKIKAQVTKLAQAFPLDF